MIPEKKTLIPTEINPEKVVIPCKVSDGIKESDHRCFIINAKAGFGKTAVVSAYFSKNEKNEKAFWYRADATDRNPERLLAGLETVIGVKTDESVSQHDRLDRIADAMDEMAEHAWFIVDNMHQLGEGEALTLFLLLLRYTNKARFILMTNAELPASLRMMVMKREAVLFDETYFKLGPDTYKNGIIVGEKGSKDRFTEKMLRFVCEGFGGWGLGVVRSIDYLMGKNDHGKSLLKKSPNDIWTEILKNTGLETVIGDIFIDGCDEKIVRLLSTVSLIGEFSNELCQAVSDEEFSDSEFSKMTQMVSVCTPLHDGWYRMGEAFSTYISSSVLPSEKKRIFASAAAWYRDHGDYARMTEYALSGSEESLLIEALQKNGVSLLTGRVALSQIVNYLEGRDVKLPPEAAGVVAQYFYLEGRLDRAEKYLNEADLCFGKENRYSAYRSLYRALSRYEEDEDKYTKQIRSAVFFLKEADEPFPRLTEGDERKLSKIMRDKTGSGSLKVSCFGRFSVICGEDEKELAWRTKKGRELFAYLIDIEGEPVDRRRLMETLWPEEIPENAVAMLHNMIYNIRKELSDYRLEKLITYENKLYTINMDEIESDSMFWSRMAEYVKKNDPEELTRNIEAFLFYPGRYLDDIDNVWVAEKREYYDSVYRSGCEILAEYEKEQGNSDRAIQLYSNILITDPYSESTVEELIKLYGERREWEKMKHCYEDFRTLLNKDLGIEPEPELEQAYKSFSA